MVKAPWDLIQITSRMETKDRDSSLVSRVMLISNIELKIQVVSERRQSVLGSLMRSTMKDKLSNTSLSEYVLQRNKVHYTTKTQYPPSVSSMFKFV